MAISSVEEELNGKGSVNAPCFFVGFSSGLWLFYFFIKKSLKCGMYGVILY